MWQWFITAMATLAGNVLDFFLKRFVLEKATQYTLITMYIGTVFALFLALTLSMKAMVLGARIWMPSTIGMVTWFLPKSLPQIFATIVTFRVSVAIYRWTIQVIGAYMPYRGSMGEIVRR